MARPGFFIGTKQNMWGRLYRPVENDIDYFLIFKDMRFLIKTIRNKILKSN